MSKVGRSLPLALVAMTVALTSPTKQALAESNKAQTGVWVEVTSPSPLPIRICPSLSCPQIVPGRESRNYGPGTKMVTAISKGSRVKAYGVVQSDKAEDCLTDNNCHWWQVDQGYIYAGFTQEVPNPPLPLELDCPNGSVRCVKVDPLALRLYAIESGNVVLATYVSTGGWNPTPWGVFPVLEKIENRGMFGTLKTTGKVYGLYDVRWQVRFFALFKTHATYWHYNFGVRRMSSGCVNLLPEDARFIYNFVEVGTPVVVGPLSY